MNSPDFVAEAVIAAGTISGFALNAVRLRGVKGVTFLPNNTLRILLSNPVDFPNYVVTTNLFSAVGMVRCLDFTGELKELQGIDPAGAPLADGTPFCFTIRRFSFDV